MNFKKLKQYPIYFVHNIMEAIQFNKIADKFHTRHTFMYNTQKISN